MAPPPQEEYHGGFLHPRRPPAHKSVSLRHTPARSRSSSGESKESSQGRPLLQDRMSSAINSMDVQLGDPHTIPITKKGSSGESSDADRWFETSNNNVGRAGLVNNDPPFFLRNSSSSDSPPDGLLSQQYLSSAHRTMLPYRSGVLRNDTEGSSVEEFRSVIDDLTIENKKLKRRLKRFEKLHDSHLQDDKLFEIRFHKLSPEKKRELEEVMKKFALGLEHSPASQPQPSPYAPPVMRSHPTSSSHTSTRFADSAYASASASGLTSQGASGSNGQVHESASASYGRQKPKQAQDASKSRQQIQSYLSDIPAGLLPMNLGTLSDKAKKKLVVRRLEQVFAGKGATVEGHQQHQQQQEVSQVAAKADQAEREASGKQALLEGSREARIMIQETEDPMESTTLELRNAQLPAPPKMNLLRPNDKPEEHESASTDRSPDQRPTRPLDLDPQRAQIPAENMEYIRHLGFTPPDMEGYEAHEEGHGWIYLNLLTNMAQLHTINVTVDFVKNAIAEYSKKLELSEDGRKVRWGGGPGLSLSLSDSTSPAQLSGSPSSAEFVNLHKPSRKRTKLSNSQSGSGAVKNPNSTGASHSRDKLAYTPLFFHKEDSEDDDYSSDDIGTNDPTPFRQPEGNSSAFTSSGMRTVSGKRKRLDGPIIFYNKFRFCTDLSGDSNPNPDHEFNTPTYNCYSSQPIGVSVPKLEEPFPNAEPKGPLNNLLEEDRMDVDSTSTPTVNMDSVSPSLKSANSNDQITTPDDFEVSGIGGVQPSDNFTVRVHRRHTQDPKTSRQLRSKARRNYKTSIRKALGPHSPQAHPVSSTIVKARVKSFRPSELPPALCLPLDLYSDDSDIEQSEDDDMGSLVEGASGPPPATAPQFLNFATTSTSDCTTTSPPGSNSEYESEDGNDQDDDAESERVDFLAAARQLDPETIRAKEREYDAEMAERLADEIPAGSSAATAGGGSGYNSPAGSDEDKAHDEGNSSRR